MTRQWFCKSSIKIDEGNFCRFSALGMPFFLTTERTKSRWLSGTGILKRKRFIGWVSLREKFEQNFNEKFIKNWFLKFCIIF